MNHKIAALFPGQGAFYRGALAQCRTAWPQIDSVFTEIDGAAETVLGRPVSEVLFGPKPAEISELLKESPDLLQLAIYGISVATYKVLEACGLRPAVLMGHSFGEIASLVCSGAITVPQGAEIVIQRTASLKALTASGGYMAALSTDRTRAERLLEVVGSSQTAIASENHSGQTVISGAKEEMDRCGEVAKALSIPFSRLNSPFPFHSPMMKAVCADFHARIKHIASAPMKVPVFSPILQRYYSDSDRLAECLAQHLIAPVRFAGAVQRLYEEGIRLTVECGALDTLSKLAAKASDKPDLTSVACLIPAIGEGVSLKKAIEAVAGNPSAGGPPITDMRALLPEVNPGAFDVFWSTRGREILDHVKLVFADFEAANRIPESKALPAQPAITRATLYADLVALYAAALEYPPEVFTEQVELEAELGIDSVKQIELLARVAERYQLPPRTRDSSLSDYSTLGKVADFVYARLHQSAAVADASTQVAAAPAREVLFTELTASYASALEYPREVFTEDVELEADLGIDSVKQTELLARVAEKYSLPDRPAGFRLSDYSSMGKITDFVLSLMAGEQTGSEAVAERKEAAAQPAAESHPARAHGLAATLLPAPSASRPEITRDTLARELKRMYAAALEYPEEVFTDDVHLEAELGIDSVKQTELLARVSEEYHLPDRPADFRLSTYDTMGKITDFVFSVVKQRASGQQKSNGVNGLAAQLVVHTTSMQTGAYIQ